MFPLSSFKYDPDSPTSWRASASLSWEDRYGVPLIDVKAIANVSTCQRWAERTVDTRRNSSRKKIKQGFVDTPRSALPDFFLRHHPLPLSAAEISHLLGIVRREMPHHSSRI